MNQLVYPIIKRQIRFFSAVQPPEKRRHKTKSKAEYKAAPIQTVVAQTPRSIKTHLDQFIVGQDSLKKSVSVAIYNHYLRIESKINKYLENSLEIEKSNLILVGPTGCGKTLVAKTTASLLRVPFSMNDATPLTQAGYVGEDVEVMISRLLQNADYDVARAERGIVFLDEIDKIAKKNEGGSPSQRDVSGEGVQQALLRMLEGTIVTITVKGSQGSRKGIQNGEIFQVDTSNILFILSGAFVGLEKIISKRSIGFGAHVHSTVQKNLALVEPEDLVSYGFIPEFVGRIPIIASASNLTIDELIEILTEPKNALIKQYQALFAKSGIDLRFHRDAITRIAEIAVTKKTGARGLRRVIEMVLHTALYEYPGTDIGYIVVLESSVNGGTVASFKRGDEEGADMCLYTGVVSVADAKDLPTTWDLLEEICLYEAAVVVEEAAKQD